jgi:hypothetical protein
MNEQLKPYKTVEEIAKKHRLEVSFIQKQLDMGAPIEHEHTKNQKLATEIALQHLDEIPDYYTRLKKMEADAKKHHKKFKDVKEETKSGDEGLHDWFNKSKSSDGKKGWVQLGGKFSGKPCARQPGQTSTPKCGSSKMKRTLSKDEEESARRRKNRLDPNQPEKTGASKPTNVRTEEMDLQEVKDKAGKGSGKKDACYNKVKSRYDVWPSAYASGALVKCRKVGAANWGTKSEDCWDGYKEEGMKKKGKKMVPNCVPVKEETGMVRYCPKCKKDETQSECKYGPKFWALYSTPPMLTTNQMKFDIAQVHPANEGYDHEYSMARSEISTIIKAANRLKKKVKKGEGSIEAWVQSKITKAADYIDTAADYVDSGEMQKEQISFEVGHTSQDTRNALRQDKIRKLASQGSTQGERNAAKGKLSGIQLPLANSTDLKTFGEFMSEASAAWQKKEGKRESGGLNKKGVESYRRENPGSKLQTAVTTDPSKLKKGSKASNRRKSFCARMSGMKKKLTSAKTANDPNSRINKSLRAWNC